MPLGNKVLLLPARIRRQVQCTAEHRDPCEGVRGTGAHIAPHCAGELSRSELLLSELERDERSLGLLWAGQERQITGKHARKHREWYGLKCRMESMSRRGEEKSTEEVKR